MKRFLCITFIFSATFVGTELLRAQTQPASKADETFAIIYEPGPNWIKGKTFREQDLMEHGQYMSKLLDEGRLEMGGPFSDSTGGMAIITAKDADAANNIVKNDPGVTKGVFKATVRPWFVVFRKRAA